MPIIVEGSSIGLNVQIGGGSNSNGAELSGNSTEFGIASGGSDQANELTSGSAGAEDEFLELVFLQFDVFLLEADFNDLAGSQEYIEVNGGFFDDLSNPAVSEFNEDRQIRDADTSIEGSNDDIFDFTFGGTTSGLEVGFETLSFTPGTSAGGFTVGSVGLQSLTISIGSPPTPGVPEPNSMLALMGLAGLLTTRRRR